MRFVPDDPDPLFRLRRRGAGPKINPRNGSIQLRYEAIDTMEKKALTPFSSDATASNIELASEHGGRGYICSTQLGPYGRPIAFVFTGDINHADGSEIFLGPDDIMSSINIAQLERGHAYPLFYDALFDDLRQRCTEVTRAAKADGRGVWAADATNSGAPWTGSVETMAPIFPKLWRRIDKFVDDDTLFETERPFDGLKQWIEQTNSERVHIPSTGAFTGFDDVIETTDQTVKMTVEPHDMVIVSRS